MSQAMALLATLLGPLFAAALVVHMRSDGLARAALRARLRALAPAGAVAPGQEGPLRRLGDMLARTPLVGKAEITLLRQNLYAAGMVSPGAVDTFIGLKILLSGLLVMLVLLWLQWSPDPPPAMVGTAIVLGAALVGLRGPDFVVARRAAARRDLIDRGLPDALDLLVVCAEAGVGIELGLERVARELKDVHPELASELAVTVSEMRLLSDRLQGLYNMGERVHLESVRSIASTLSQTLRYGTPLGKALRTLTADFRLIRQTRMEERAARLPVIITVPMIMFILPATTLVVAGPAFLQLIAALQKM